MRKRSFIFSLFFFTFFYLFSKSALANYDCYVRSNYKYQGIGSQKQPFNKLSQATNLDRCRNIFISNGIYDELNIVVRDGVTLTGEEMEGVVITKDLKMEGLSSLDNLSVITKKYSCRGDIYTVGVSVDNNAKVSIKNSIISNAREGIQVKENAEVIVDNSNIVDNCKGLYILSNSIIKINNSEINDNWGEGIDIRGAVSGEIIGNKINNNGECGAELIIGNSDLKLLNNEIINNKASGITVQFYDKGAGANAKGKIEIEGSVILNNEEYGLSCKRPNGGNPGGSYWSETVKIKQNEMRGNIDGNFSSSCKFSGKIKSKAIKVVNDEDKIQKEYYDFLDKDISRQIKQTAVQNRSKIKTFFIGSDYEKLDELDDIVKNYNDYITELDVLLESDIDQGFIDDIKKYKKETIELRNELRDFINGEKGKFSLFGWLFKLFN